MPYIVRYQKVTDSYTTHQLAEPYDADGASLATELCTLIGYTYVSIADGATLPPQPAEITVETVVLDDVLRTAIKAACPHVRLIDQRMQEKIRAAFSMEDELYLARISIGAMMGTYTLQPGEDMLLNDYQAFIEDVRAWGRAERAKLGL
jgi:hypothetical protein